MPPSFLDGVEFESLRHLPRYLKALTLRAERAANNPVKDAERAKAVAPYQAALARLSCAACDFRGDPSHRRVSMASGRI